MESQIKEISIAEITDPAAPMRSGIDREEVWNLAESIKREGLINPITVRPKDGRYEVVAGHRRFVACKIAGLPTIQCVVRELDDAQSFEIMAHENLERQDVDPVDEALFLGRLIGEDTVKIKETAEKLNRSIQWVEDRLMILTYPDFMIEAIKSGKLKLGVAKHLSKIEDEVYLRMYVNTALVHGMSVAHAEYYGNCAEQGVLANSEKILPPPDGTPEPDAAKARAMCERCGRMAVHPNLRSALIHVECPAADIPSGSQ